MAIILGSLTPAEQITSLYVGYFNRAPDPEGLDYWIGRLTDSEDPMTIAEIAKSFADQPEAAEEYPYLAVPTVSSATSFLQSVYFSLFNREVDADDEGLQYWLGELMEDSGDIGEIIVNIISGAQGDDREVVLNKIEVGVDFATSFAAQGILDFNQDRDDDGDADDDAVEAGNLAETILQDITANDASVAEAKQQIDQALVFELDLDGETTIGTTSDDLFNAELGNLTDDDVIRGRNGNDTLRADIDGVVAPTISSVERVFLSSDNAFGIDLSNVSGVQQLWATGNNNTFNVSNVTDLSTTFGVSGGTGTLAYDIDVAAGVDLDGDADTLNLAVNDTDGSVTFTFGGDADDIENITVASMGDADSDNDVDLTNFDDIETVTVTGSADIFLSIDSDDLETLDASAATGGVTADLSILTNGITMMGGSGKDLLTAGSGGDSIFGNDGDDVLNGNSGDDLLVGGAGNDTINAADGNDIIGGGAGNDEINVGFVGSTEVHFNGATGADVVIGFDTTDDVVSFLDGGVIDFANSEEDDVRGDSDLDADDYIEFDSIGQFLISEGNGSVDADQKVVNITGDSSINAIGQLSTDDAAEFYAAFEVGTDTQIYYDADWSTTGGRELVATLTGTTGLTVDNFDVY